MARASIAVAAPEVAATLRAVYRVGQAARTTAQRRAASRITNQWTALALDGGWTIKQIADAVGVHRSVVSRRAAEHCKGGQTVPPLAGVEALQPAPEEPKNRPEPRKRLLSAGEVARLVGCVPGSVPYWAASRGVPFQWSPGRGRRLYDRDSIVAAARAHPTVTHRKHRPRRVQPTVPGRGLAGPKSTWTKLGVDTVGKRGRGTED